jgi:hypothetical protein
MYECVMCKGSFEGKPARTDNAGVYCADCRRRKNEAISARMRVDKKQNPVIKLMDWFLRGIRAKG